MVKKLVSIVSLVILLIACKKESPRPVKEEFDILKPSQKSEDSKDLKKTIKLSDLNLPERARNFLEKEQKKDKIVFEIADRKFDLKFEEITDIIDNFPHMATENAPSFEKVIDYSKAKRGFAHFESPANYLIYAYMQYNINELTKQQKDLTLEYIEMADLSLYFAYAQLISGSFGFEHSVMSIGEAIQWVLNKYENEEINESNFRKEHSNYMQLIRKRAWQNFEYRAPYAYLQKDIEQKKRKELKDILNKISNEVNTPLKLHIFKKVNFSTDYEYMKDFGVFDEN